MRVFNPEKELSKIRNGNKNKIIVGLCTLLLIVIVGYSFALYQVRHTQKLVFNTVGEFKKRDIILSVLVDGENKTEFPGKDDGYVFERLDCDKEGTSATFDKVTWELVLRTDKPNKCTVVFGTKPNEPELFQGLIPITIDDDGTIKVADIDADWYDYGEHKWANAVLVTTAKYNELTQDNQLRKDKAGTILNLDIDILQMYVWIPRYKYQLFNVNNEAVPEQMINIQFEKETKNTGDITCIYNNLNNGVIEEKCIDKESKLAENGDWYTHPAFTFGETDLKGLWVGKFVNSGNSNTLKILPNVVPVKLAHYSSFTAIRNIELETAENYNLDAQKIDTHMLKNIDWGAIAYLTQSKYGRFNGDGNSIIYGAEVYVNNTTNTGCAAEEKYLTAVIECTEQNRWNQNGVKSSTTGNMYGIYDMVGLDEAVMGFGTTENGSFCSDKCNFSGVNPDLKYYDIYTFENRNGNLSRGHLGDATREVLNTNSRLWYDGYRDLPYATSYLVRRGGAVSFGTGASLFTISFTNSWVFSSRTVITAQDGVH